MNVLELCDSDYLKAEDLGGRPHNVTIKRVEAVTFGRGASKKAKAVVFTAEFPKGIVLSDGSARRVAALYGGESDGWTDKFITIFPTECQDDDGELTPCIRVRSQAPAIAPAIPGNTPRKKK